MILGFWAALAGLPPALISIASAVDTNLSRQTLKGVNAIGVIVEDLNPEVEHNGLSKSSIQTDVELRLREAGIPVSSQEQFSSERGAPYLHLELLVKADNRSRWAFSIATEFNQVVQLRRDPSVQGRAVTWSISGVGTVARQNVRELMGIIKQDTGKFINAYLAANPK